jgi:hypothetical protein
MRTTEAVINMRGSRIVVRRLCRVNRIDCSSSCNGIPLLVECAQTYVRQIHADPYEKQQRPLDELHN